MTTDPNDPNGFHRYYWKQTSETTATITWVFPDAFNQSLPQFRQLVGYDKDFTFAATLEGNTWVVREPKFHRFAGIIVAVGVVGASLGTIDPTQGGAIASANIDLSISFVGNNLKIVFKKGNEALATEVASPE